MKIAILYICTGKYTVFWKDFYSTSEKYFIPNVEKHYFVFTDASDIYFENNDKKICKIFQENLGWPNNTLKRYEIFLKIKDKLQRFDYIFFLNANLLFLNTIEDHEFLPDQTENLVACLHPGYFDKSRDKFTYEKNTQSTAYIPKELGRHYFAGGINGGRATAFIDAMEQMNKNIVTDGSNNIIATWHDESYWNKYLVKREDIHILNPSYLYPEGAKIPFDKKILIRDKKNLGGHSHFRNKIELRLIINKSKDFVKNIFRHIVIRKTIRIQGGLGNQMFQYAYGRKLELLKKKIIFNTSFFHGNRSNIDTARSLQLKYFKLDTGSEFSDKTTPKSNFINLIIRRLNIKSDDFFQNEKYFKGIKEIIRKEFTLKEPFGISAQKTENEIINSNNPISIHIRRGDYVANSKTNAYHGVCRLDYYERAIEYIKSKIKSPTFFIFSDDINWAKENLKLENSIFVSNPDIKDYEELILMSKCKHNIIANSTFSWWGAWLNPNSSKIVIGPKQWTINKTSIELDILPKEWIQL